MRSSETERFALSRRTASKARCFGPPSGMARPVSSTSSDPRMRKSIAARRDCLIGRTTGLARVSGSEPLTSRRPELEQVRVRVVEVVRTGLHPVEVDRPVDIDTRLPHAVDCCVELVARNLEGKMHRAPAFSARKRRLILEEQRAAMETDPLRRPGPSRPEPRPVVGGLVLERQTNDVAVEARRRRNVLDDENKLREPARAHARWASYMPN